MLYRIFIFCLLCTASLLNGQISFNNSSFVYTQDFNTLATSGTTNSSLPSGWLLFEAGSNGNTSYRAGDGGSNAGDTYSFGTGTNTERAFGAIASGNLQSFLGARFVNNTGTIITRLNITYTGEQWRNGGNTSTQDLIFSYQIGATALNTGSWTTVPQLTFTSPTAGASASALDGNDPANQTNIQHELIVNINPGQEIWFRWEDINDTGNDHGLAIDDFMITSIVLPVKFTNVRAHTMYKEVLVQFGTASEINNDYFTIERSSDGIHFSELDRIKGQGNSSRLTEYEYVDHYPLAGHNFYRIKQTDYDGKSAYSQVVKASTRNFDLAVEVYSDGQNLSMTSPEEIRSVTLFDMSGAQIFHKNVNTHNLEINQVVSTPGLYIVMVKTSGQTYQKLVWMM